MPIVIYVILCYNLKSESQIKAAVVLGTLFAFVMISMILGTVARILNSPLINPSGILLYTIIFVFLIAALLHPREFSCLYAGLLYYVAVPVAFVLLNIYAIINLNNVSWGTRETRKASDASIDIKTIKPSKIKQLIEFLKGDSTSEERKSKFRNYCFGLGKLNYDVLLFFIRCKRIKKDRTTFKINRKSKYEIRGENRVSK